MINPTTLYELGKYDFDLAIYVAEFQILLFTIKPNLKKSLKDRILKKFKKAHNNTPENYEKIFEFMLKLYENQEIINLHGLGGSKQKTIEELLIEFDFIKNNWQF